MLSGLSQSTCMRDLEVIALLGTEGRRGCQGLGAGMGSQCAMVGGSDWKGENILESVTAGDLSPPEQSRLQASSRRVSCRQEASA